MPKHAFEPKPWMPCKHRHGVTCADRRLCSLCGWYKPVEAQRKQLLRTYGLRVLCRQEGK